MYKDITYNNKKLEELIRSKHLIPYKLGMRDRYIKNNFYYSAFTERTFKVLFVKYHKSGELMGAEIRYENGMQAYICTDIDPGYDYRVEKDFGEIYKKKNIVNDGCIYSGAEIIYWFFINNITCFNRKYKKFWHLVDTYSFDRINDNKMYRVLADESPYGRYYNCRILEVVEKDDTEENVYGG